MAKYGYTGSKHVQSTPSNSGIFNMTDVYKLIEADQWTLQTVPLETLVVAGGGGGGGGCWWYNVAYSGSGAGAGEGEGVEAGAGASFTLGPYTKLTLA